MPPCHRHMVIATNLSSLFDLLHCSIPQTRTECCLEFAVVSGYRMFLGLSGSALPPPTVPVRRAMQGPPPISQHSNSRSVACVRGVFPVCYIAVPCVTVLRTTRSQNHFTNWGSNHLPVCFMCRIPKAEPAPLPPREAGLASNPESTVARVLGAFQVCSLLVIVYWPKKNRHGSCAETFWVRWNAKETFRRGWWGVIGSREGLARRAL